MSLEHHLVLNRYLHHLLGAEDFETLKNVLRPLAEGPDASGQSFFYGALAGLNGQIPRADLQIYDRRVMAYEATLRRSRKDFQAFRYFQYLALLYTEIFLDGLTRAPQAFLADLNAWLKALKSREPVLSVFPDFTPDDLRRLAFFMATGSGKTLLMHVNIWQALYYLQNGAHPEALLPGAPQDRRFDNIILITPNEGLSAQHIAELRASGLSAVEFVSQPNARGTAFSPLVKVIEIHKLAETASKGGVSLVMSSIGSNNLVIVDEGHKGTGSKARTWKTRQKYLSAGGFLLEYSATFAQAIGAASKKSKQQLLHEYGKAILFDYSYAHFYGDGYGKDFRVLNLKKGSAPRAHELLVGGLLTFYHQLYLYQRNQAAYRPYNLEKPLWVLLGSSVNATYTRQKQKRSDVAEVVAFLQRFLEDPQWAVSVMARILAGNSGFQDDKTGQDLFAQHIPNLLGQDAQALYDALRAEIFRGSGGLEVWQIKNADGEFGLRLSQADEGAPYFGVINIGDVSAFKKYLNEHLNLEVKEDAFRSSQFAIVDHPDSPIYLLIGAKKFIEGWSSWRVSAMGLLNVGKGEGSQIIQLFGRGVRLKGKGMSLKRSAALDHGQSPPENIRFIETLAIFGWNADYIEAFQKFLEAEDLPREFVLPVAKMDPWPDKKLPLPEKQSGFDARTLTWTLDASGLDVALDRTPKVAAVATRGAGQDVVQGGGALQGALTIDFSAAWQRDVLHWQALYHALLAYKRLRGYENIFIPADVLPEILEKRATLRILASDLNMDALQSAAEELLKAYLDRFVRMKERQAESQHVQVGYLNKDDSRVQTEYRLRVRGGQQLLAQVQQILGMNNLHTQTIPGRPLPRFYWDRSLFNPLLLHGHDTAINIAPAPLNPGEYQFIKDLWNFWIANHNKPAYVDDEIYILRNLAISGIGLFHRSGFYPDFILWRRSPKTGKTKVIFIEPHGIHDEGLSGNLDKFAALKALRALSRQPNFQQAGIVLDGYMLTDTPLGGITDANGLTKAQIEQKYPLRWMEGDYIKGIL